MAQARIVSEDDDNAAIELYFLDQSLVQGKQEIETDCLGDDFSRKQVTIVADGGLACAALSSREPRLEVKLTSPRRSNRSTLNRPKSLSRKSRPCRVKGLTVRGLPTMFAALASSAGLGYSAVRFNLFN